MEVDSNGLWVRPDDLNITVLKVNISKNIMAPQCTDCALGAPGVPTRILRVGPALARPNALSSVVYNLSHYTV